jgi:phosphoribosylglycinamide formyltransferase-1
VKKKRLGVLVSGRGSNLQALIDASINHEYPVEIAVVISNKADAFALERARNASIPAIFLNRAEYKSRKDYDAAIHDCLIQHGVELVCLAGYMMLVSEWLVKEWWDKMINIHPSLLPAFKGLNAQKQALDFGVKITGCTVHYVRTEMDSGPIIAQSAVEVLPNDTEDSLSERILKQEHIILVESIRQICT